MISDTYNISEFLDKAKNCSYRRVLVMADQEATEVDNLNCYKWLFSIW